MLLAASSSMHTAGSRIFFDVCCVCALSWALGGEVVTVVEEKDHLDVLVHQLDVLVHHLDVRVNQSLR